MVSASYGVSEAHLWTAAYHGRTSPDELRRLDAGGHLIVLEDGAGSAVLQPLDADGGPGTQSSGGEWRAGMFAVDLDRQGDGLGARLLDAVKALAIERRADVVSLGVLKPLDGTPHPHGDRLVAWYGRHGWEPWEEVPVEVEFPPWALEALGPPCVLRRMRWWPQGRPPQTDEAKAPRDGE